MALLSTLMTALSRKLGDLLQALFGWSVAALFGRLNSKTQVLVTLALLLSLCWPVFVVGVFFPEAATFLIAFVPIDNETVRSVLRVVWTVLAVTAPVFVGLLVRSSVKPASRKSAVASMLNGYPLALGMALSFLVTLVTVPLIKLTSVVRRWEEQHIFVQPREHRYEDALRHLVIACEASDLEPRVEPVPRQMSLSVKILRFFSRGAIDSLLAENPRRVASEGLELYLYPADLLVRGEPKKVAHVRARLSSTMLERDAWLVREPEAQELQDDLCRLRDVVDDHEHMEDVRDSIDSRLEGLEKAAWRSEKIPFEDWLALDRMARRLEADVHGHHSRFDRHAEAAATQLAPKRALNLDEASLPELVSELAREARDLAKTEAELAANEAAEVGAAALRSTLGFAATIALTGAAVVLGVAAIVFTSDDPVIAACVAAGVLAAVAAAVFIGAYASVPKEPMNQTRRRLARGWRLIAERAS